MTESRDLLDGALVALEQNDWAGAGRLIRAALPGLEAGAGLEQAEAAIELLRAAGATSDSETACSLFGSAVEVLAAARCFCGLCEEAADGLGP